MPKSQLVLREGFWKTGADSRLPLPKARKRPWRGQKAFLEALAKKEGKAHEEAYKGWSNCRICDKKNGSTEYQLGSWRWPAGYVHYVKDHNVRPSLAFQEFVEGCEVE